MQPLKPKRRETVKETYEITKRTRAIVELYSKYSEYAEGEILDYLAEQVIKEDKDFMEWLSGQRFKKKAEQFNLFEYIACNEDTDVTSEEEAD